MRAHSMAAAVLAIALPPVAAFAAPPPTNVLLAGYIVPKAVPPNNATWCMTDAASSTFLRGQSPARTQMSFAEIIYTSAGSVGPTAYRLSGQARLFFNQGSTTAGTVEFDANAGDPANIHSVSFVAYGEYYNTTTHTLSVHFRLLFPNCTLPIVAVYRN